MSIFEYDEEAVIRVIRQDEREQGKDEKLCEQIRKKLNKNKSIAQIAEELEETEETVQRLIEEKNI